MIESRFYFDNGLSLHEAFAKNEVANLRYLQTIFEVKLTARDGGVAVEGEPPQVERILSFFEELTHFFIIRRRQIDQRDFEMLARSFRDNREQDLRKLWSEKISVSPKKRDILPRSLRQYEYVRAMRTRDMVFGIGPAGTGKTYLAMAMAISEYLQGNFSRIVLTRPARESGENLGFLPGSLEEKIMPYLRPLYDALYEMLSFDEAKALIEKDIIEVAPLAFMRGRTLNNAFIILDEAQNTTEEQMLMFLTRMGFNSRCIITGDPTQADLKSGEKSGLRHAIHALRPIREIEFCFFDTCDVVRHALLEKIITAYQKGDHAHD